MQVGQSGSGMQTMAQSLVSLYQRRMITLEEAFAAAADGEEIRAMLEPRQAVSSRNNGPKQP
jgi:twitching motility protein PilT